MIQTQVLHGRDGRGARALANIERARARPPGMRLAAAALALAEGRPEQAVDVLAPVIARARERRLAAGAQPRWATVHALLLDAARARPARRPARGGGLDRARARARRAGRDRPAVRRSRPSGELLERHRRHRTAHAALLPTILDVLAGTSPPPARHGAARSSSARRSCASCATCRATSRRTRSPSELFVSSNTVRTHLRHIYAKLDAHSRSEAVARARELGLLAPGGLSR